MTEKNISSSSRAVCQNIVIGYFYKGTSYTHSKFNVYSSIIFEEPQ